jgi:hypothetical protein
MQVSVAVYTFISSIFVIFVLWGTKNLGLLGLLSSFAVGLITYSFTDSLEISVAAIILGGILINFLYPYIQHRWVESYHNYTAQDVIDIKNNAIAKFKASNAPGLAPQINEGFQTEPTTARGSVAGRAGMVAPGATMTKAAPGATMTTAAPGAAMAAPGAAMAAPGAPMGGTGATMAAPGAAMAAPGAAMAAPGGAAMAGGQAVMIPNMNSSGATAIQTAPRAAPVDMSTVQASSVGGSEPAPLQNAPAAAAQNTVNASGSPTAPTSGLNSMPTGTSVQDVTAPNSTTDNTGQQTEVAAFKNPSTSGLFKLGELPSSAANGPHIDAGTTIMRALGALNSDQISSLTADTRQLLDTQKSLMNMLTTMKPMLSDGQNLLASFTNMFGKQ